MDIAVNQSVVQLVALVGVDILAVVAAFVVWQALKATLRGIQSGMKRLHTPPRNGTKYRLALTSGEALTGTLDTVSVPAIQAYITQLAFTHNSRIDHVTFEITLVAQQTVGNEHEQAPPPPLNVRAVNGMPISISDTPAQVPIGMEREPVVQQVRAELMDGLYPIDRSGTVAIPPQRPVATQLSTHQED